MMITFKSHRQILWLRIIFHFMIIMLLNKCSSKVAELGNSRGDIMFVSGRQRSSSAILILLNSEDKRWAYLRNTEHVRSAPPTWDPTGQAIAFEEVLGKEFLDQSDSDYGKPGIVILDSQGNREVFGPCLFSPAWSPDGKMLAFHNACETSTSLNIETVDGLETRVLFPNLTHQTVGQGNIREIRISWSPDAQYIVFDYLEKEMSYLWVVNIDDATSYKLTSGRQPAWSPLGDRIAFERDDDIWIISINDKVEYKLINDPVRAEWPTWSPSGQELAFVSYRDGNSEIYRVKLNGSDLENLTQHPSWDLYPTWRP